ncbi:probable peptidoglycan muropeptide transporter SLC46 [Diabrotica undecimpunctata]|uniref:probable peptidoglycan muropeptide transporter SLC46 n=1 Tax=Diabrotica undecimpunctata TaxID=50387 RepID=UPI003B641A8A
MAWYKYFSVEVPLCLLIFSGELCGSVFTNLLMYRTCYTILGYPESDCAQLGNDVNNVTIDLEPKVQPTVNYINMVQNILHNTFPIFFCMYVGTWSDKFGRKPFLLLSMICGTISSINNFLIAHFTYASSWWFVAAGIPSMVMGGMSTGAIVTSAYLIDVSTKQDRVVRLAVFEFILMSSGFVSKMISSRVLYATSYEIMYLISIGLQIPSILYTIFFVPESRKDAKKLKTIFNSKDICSNLNFKAVLQAAFRPRENKINRFLFIVIAIQLIWCFSMGDMQVFSLYLRNRLHWTVSKMNFVSSITSVGHMILASLGTYILYKVLKIKEMRLALLGVASITIVTILRALATSDMYIYIGNFLGCFGGLTMLMWKTVMSYMLRPEEMGNILALMSILQSLISLLSGLVYPAIYNATINTNSGLYNYLSLAINIIVGISILILSRLDIPHYQPDPIPPSADQESANNEKTSKMADTKVEILNESQDDQRF